MSLLYVICAAVGGTALVCQFLLSLFGLHGHHDVPGDMPDDVGGDFGHDVGHDAGGGDHADPASADHDPHGSTSIFRVISVRTVIAALAFFGLTGLAANSAELSAPSTLILSLAAGVGAMYAVHWLMQQLFRLRADGTVRLQRAIGAIGTVYVKVPAREQGAGKVLLTLQNRTVELEAVTVGDELPTGTQVVVSRMAGTEIVQVERLPESGNSAASPRKDEVTHV
jgi:hypothetical protein